MKQISLAYSPAHSGLLSGSKWLSVVPCWSRSGFHCSLPLSGSLLVSNFAYTVLAWLARSLLGSQRCCHESSLYQGPLQKNLFFKFFIYQPVQSKSLFVISVSKISCDTETLPTSSTPAVIVLLTITQYPGSGNTSTLWHPVLDDLRGSPRVSSSPQPSSFEHDFKTRASAHRPLHTVSTIDE